MEIDRLNKPTTWRERALAGTVPIVTNFLFRPMATRWIVLMERASRRQRILECRGGPPRTYIKLQILESALYRIGLHGDLWDKEWIIRAVNEFCCYTNPIQILKLAEIRLL
jgi:hypothetical protein